MYVPDMLPCALYIEYVLNMLHWVCYQLKALQQLIMEDL